MLTIEGNGWVLSTVNNMISLFGLSFQEGGTHIFTPTEVGMKDTSELREFFVNKKNMDADTLINTLNHRAENQLTT